MRILSKRTGLIVVLMISTLFLSGCVRDVTLTYSISIIPKEGETLRNVTVYLPFPAYRDKPIRKIFNDIETGYKKWRKDEFPGTKFDFISTSHGTMLKVTIPKLDEGFPLYGKCTLINTVFDKTFPQDKYILSTIEQEISNGKKKSYVHIYSDFEDGTGFILDSLYDVTYGEWGFTRVHGGWITLIGTDEVPSDYSGRPYEIEINKKGWVKLPTTW